MDDGYSATVYNHGCALLPLYEQPNMANLVHPNVRVLRHWLGLFLQIHQGGVRHAQAFVHVMLTSQDREDIGNESAALRHREGHRSAAEFLTAPALVALDTVALPRGLRRKQ